jgi:hypothetical protein
MKIHLYGLHRSIWEVVVAVVCDIQVLRKKTH